MAGGLTRLLRAPLGPAEAYARMAAAVGKDLAATVVPGGEGDPFKKRDPGYIERTLPAKISIRVGKPIDLRKRLGQRPDPDAGYELITSTMQRTLTGLSNQRTLPVLG
jgi:hypothetical protein